MKARAEESKRSVIKSHFWLEIIIQIRCKSYVLVGKFFPDIYYAFGTK